VGKPSPPPLPHPKKEREKTKKATVSIMKISTVLGRKIRGSRVYVPSRKTRIRSGFATPAMATNIKKGEDR
jgi:hypothetical protein